MLTSVGMVRGWIMGAGLGERSGMVRTGGLGGGATCLFGFFTTSMVAYMGPSHSSEGGVAALALLEVGGDFPWRGAYFPEGMPLDLGRRSVLGGREGEGGR